MTHIYYKLTSACEVLIQDKNFNKLIYLTWDTTNAVCVCVCVSACLYT